ncbi:MAG: DUF4142 domain-containing protein [Chitinophagaceae bacterium]|nr:MAG: DUF4142 domain-containing protein [Chitinophagaceae bacterium]
MKKTSLLLIAASAFVFACNDAAETDPVEKADSSNEAKLDRAEDSGAAAVGPVTPVDEASAEFFTKAADGGMAEVSLGKLAGEKATNAKVKEFAVMMVNDHTGANTGLKELASKKSITLPAAVSEDHQKAEADLAKKSGKDFDKAYIDQMVKDHENTVSLFEKGSKDVKDADLKAFIDQTLPKLKTHLEAAKSIKKSL